MYAKHYFSSKNTVKKEDLSLQDQVLWQVSTMLFSLALSLEIAITVIYWLFLADPTSIYSYTSHILPIVFLGVDFILNMIVVELN